MDQQPLGPTFRKLVLAEVAHRTRIVQVASVELDVLAHAKIVVPRYRDHRIWIVLDQPGQRLVELGGDSLIQSPSAFGGMIKAETAKWQKVVEFAGLKVE